jgi:hypothetical protein
VNATQGPGAPDRADLPSPPERPIVAELGRPETPEETAARKAETSRLHRSRQTLINLVLSLAATLAVVLVLVIVVVRPDQAVLEPVDYAATAVEAQGSIDEPLVAPILPDEWSSNSARFSAETNGVALWYIGFITPRVQFISLTQGIGADDRWLADQLDNNESTGSVTIDDVTWLVYDNRARSDMGNLEYAISTVSGNSTIVLAGTATDEEFVALATSVSTDVLGLAQ